MRRYFLLICLLWLSVPVAQAQTVRGDRFMFATGNCTLRSGTGTPEGVVVGHVCDTYWRVDTGTLYSKILGTGNTGWQLIGGVGPGTVNRIPKFTTTSTIGDSAIEELGGHILPVTTYGTNLGSVNKKFLSIWAAELNIETLVAQDVMATIGGRITVAPTNVLVGALTTGATSMTVKYNNLANGDRVYMESGGKIEFMAITSSAGGSAGAYTYSITRDLDGSGANPWDAGDAILNTGQTGNGFIDIYSTRGIKAGTEIGPSLVGNVRNSSTYNDWSARWALGNLNGLYGYGTNTYGAAFGVPGGARVTIDPTNGIRIYGGDNDEKVTIDTAGNATFDGSVTVGTGRNMIRNPDCKVSTQDWIQTNNTGLTETFAGPWTSGTWDLGGNGNDCYVSVSGTPTAGTVTDVYGGGTAGTINGLSVKAGQKYEASVYVGIHRAGNSYALIQFFNSANALVGTSAAGNVCTAATAGGNALAGYCRTGVIAAAPAGAAYARPFLRTEHTAEASPFIFMVHWYFGEAGDAQTKLTPWGPAGTTEIVGGLIRTGSINADRIQAGTITAAQIAAGTITGGNIAAGTITADRMSVTSLSAISANLGTVTAGTISGNTISGGAISGTTITGTTITGSTLQAGGGGGDVTINSSGLGISCGTSTSQKINFSDGSFILSDCASALTVHGGNGVFLTSGGGDLVWNGALIGLSGGHSLGSSITRWADIWLSGDVHQTPSDTTAADLPMVYSVANGIYYKKTNGYSGTCSPSSLTVQNGIVTGCS